MPSYNLFGVISSRLQRLWRSGRQGYREPSYSC